MTRQSKDPCEAKSRTIVLANAFALLSCSWQRRRSYGVATFGVIASGAASGNVLDAGSGGADLTAAHPHDSFILASAAQAHCRNSMRPKRNKG
jgi:hypothetical protein